MGIKRGFIIAAAAALLAVLLTGCSGSRPTQTAGGESWDPDWTQVGPALGVDESGNPLTLLDSKDALAAANLYYAAWTDGERTDFENADGETVDLYDAQLYLLVQACGSPQAAQDAVEEWQALRDENYRIVETFSLPAESGEWLVAEYEVTNTQNPYARGLSALRVYGGQAVNAELTCRDGYDRDLRRTLEQFLGCIRYAPAE